MSAAGGSDPCAACGKVADAECTAYGATLCWPCCVAWNDEAPSEAQAKRMHPDPVARGQAWRDYTARWCAKRRAKGAA